MLSQQQLEAGRQVHQMKVSSGVLLMVYRNLIVPRIKVPLEKTKTSLHFLKMWITPHLLWITGRLWG